MPVSIIPSFVLYCFVSAITPGPANLCSLASAMKYGRKQALRQWRGIFVGFALVALSASVIVWFLGMMLNQYLRVLTWIGAAYILWLAWHIWRSENTNGADAGDHCNFLTGLFVQLTNAKIIIFCMTALTTYSLPYAGSYWDVLMLSVFLPFTGPVANLLWLFAGASLQKAFEHYRRPISIAMALSLCFCAISIVLA